MDGEHVLIRLGDLLDKIDAGTGVVLVMDDDMTDGARMTAGVAKALCKSSVLGTEVVGVGAEGDSVVVYMR